MARWKERTSPRARGAHREEAALDAHLAEADPPPHPHVIGVQSVKGGMGNTTIAYVLGDVLAGAGLRTVVVDANDGYGTLVGLRPLERRSELGAEDLLAASSTLLTATDLRPFVTRCDSGLDLLAGTRASLSFDELGELTGHLATFYEVLILDCSAGLADGRPQRFAAQRADQHVLVTTPELAASEAVANGLERLPRASKTVVLNGVASTDAATLSQLEDNFARHQAVAPIGVPHDATLNPSGPGGLSLADLHRQTRVAIKRLACSVAEGLA